MWTENFVPAQGPPKILQFARDMKFSHFLPPSHHNAGNRVPWIKFLDNVVIQGELHNAMGIIVGFDGDGRCGRSADDSAPGGIDQSQDDNLHRNTAQR